MPRNAGSAPDPEQRAPRPGQAILPSGTVTFLFADIEGSTQLWERNPVAMEEALRRFEDLTAEAVTESGGATVRETGDGLLAAFADTGAAVSAATRIQRSLLVEPAPGGLRLRARIGLHVGDVEPVAGNYHGSPVNRCARVMDAGHGGQILVTDEVALRLTADPGFGADAPTTLRDLGLHRLRSLEHPVRLFQVCAPRLPDAFGPLRTLDHVPHNLPVPPTSLVGRAVELDAICASLATTRLVTLTGTGGSGKTRLALQVGAEISGRFPDGAWLAELGSVADGASAPAAVAGALGVPERADVGWTRAVALALADKESLLILDNCEQVAAGVACLVDALLASCPRLHILATSREPLGVSGEAISHVPPLGLPTDDSMASAVDSDAVRLFVERATAADAHFVLDGRTLPAVVRICVRLDGLPLALELAAVLVRTLPPAEIASLLDERFRLLTGGPRTALPRQRTLEATVAWSYQLLSPSEQRLFRILSIFAGEFSLAAVGQVAMSPVPTVLPDLLGLVDRSLVVASTQADGRYRLLETLRAYGRDRLGDTPEDFAQARKGHLGFVETLAGSAYAELDRGARHHETLVLVDRHLDDVRQVLAWSITEKPDRAAGVVALLLRAWASRALMEGRRYHEQLLSRPLSDPLRQCCLTALADLEVLSNEHDAAVSHVEEALSLDGIPGQLIGAGVVGCVRGKALAGAGRWAEADDVFTAASAAATRANDAEFVLEAKHFQASLALRMGDLARAGQLARECRAGWPPSNRTMPAHTEELLAVLAVLTGDAPAAATLMGTALEQIRAQGNRHCIAHALRHAAAVLYRLEGGELAAAAQMASETITLELGVPAPWWERDDIDWLLPPSCHSVGDVEDVEAVITRVIDALSVLTGPAVPPQPEHTL